MFMYILFFMTFDMSVFHEVRVELRYFVLFCIQYSLFIEILKHSDCICKHFYVKEIKICKVFTTRHESADCEFIILMRMTFCHRNSAG